MAGMIGRGLPADRKPDGANGHWLIPLPIDASYPVPAEDRQPVFDAINREGIEGGEGELTEVSDLRV